MHIKSKLYPYPILTDPTANYSFNDDYINSFFNIMFETKSTVRELILTAYPQLENDGVKYLIDNDLAYYCVHIECPLTSFRRFYPIKNDGDEIHISSNDVDGIISVCPFIVAKSDIKNYSNLSFNEVYKDLSFDLDKGSIIAIGDEISVSVEKQGDDLNNVPSIFAVTELKGANDKEIVIDNSGNKIIIELPSKTFVEFKIASTNPNSATVMHSIIIIPALMKCFEDIRSKIKEDSLFELETRRWYKVIKRVLNKNGIKFEDENMIDPFKLSQLIMDNTTNRAILGINNIAFQGDVTDE